MKRGRNCGRGAAPRGILLLPLPWGAVFFSCCCAAYLVAKPTIPAYANAVTPDRETVTEAFRALQDRICHGLELLDGRERFREDLWHYERGEGGGRTRVLSQGGLFEQGGVNFSALSGTELPATASDHLQLPPGTTFFATGVSIVLHPHNPHVPTIHMNVRYFEAGSDLWWFGGGIDLTPYLPDRRAVIAFHRTLKRTCDRFDPSYYPRFKAACDNYFMIRHRSEMRGVGGIFFDHLNHDREAAFAFTLAVGDTFLDAYTPIVAANRDRPWSQRERDFQLLRRGRYAEFNLVWDRGTKFGLESGGRTESILMSLPPLARWAYNWQPEPGTPEAELIEVFLRPQPWAELEP